METECGVAPLAQLADTIKESMKSVDIAPEEASLPYQAVDTNIPAEANGESHNEGHIFTQTSLDELTNTMISHDDDVSHFVEGALHESLAPPLDNDETMKMESNTGAVEAMVAEELVVEPTSTAEVVPDMGLEIETVKEEMLVGEGVLATSAVTAEASSVDGFDMELHVILEPGESGAGLAELAQATGDHSTSDLLTQIQSHNTEFRNELPGNNVDETVDNNNFETPEEVLNKKELLDILEGNEPENDSITDREIMNENNVEEEVDAKTEIRHLALQQLNSFQAHSRKNGRHSSRPELKIPRRKARKSHSETSQKCNVSTAQKLHNQDVEDKNTVDLPQSLSASNERADNEMNKSRDLIKVLVEDWDDDDIKDETLEEQPQAVHSVNAASAPETIAPETPDIKPSTDDKAVSENTSAESLLPKRRMSRVIKKKVIFDPDNPQTFTSKKTPISTKTKSPHVTEEQCEHPPPKKTKADISPQKTKEKFVTIKGKTQWKKPPPKNNKQNKRLSEVDRLLMDEGAVNMMYQLKTCGGDSSETPKGKNIRSKAAFIKKINQSTPETYEIKFRERKKEPSRPEEASTVRREGSRTRTSTSTSAPASSPAPDLYETHNADDSIIIRRHSSSSYSSSCLSPRRLSDLELSIPSTPSTVQPGPLASIPSHAATSEPSTDGDKFNEIFMSAVSDMKKSDVLDKKDCLSLKEKLNSKLSRVLNVKRKRENKTDNKQKKARDNEEYKKRDVAPVLTKVSIKFEDRIAEVNILKDRSEPNSVYNIDTLRELTSALEYIERRSDVSVTLLLSESGDLCGGIDLHNIQQLKTDDKLKHKAASDLADAVRSLFVSMEQHTKFVCAGVEGACVGVGLALLALCDVVLASDRATFRLVAGEGELSPAVAVLTSHRKSLCRSLITEMLVFGRQLSASEALSRGLVSRTLWPDRFSSELRAMVRDIAAQPLHALQLKKKLLGLRNTVDQQSTFLSCLDAERDLLSDYWSSAHCKLMSRSTE